MDGTRRDGERAGSVATDAKGKVFGIGLSRTGTTSLSAALAALGFRARHFPRLDRLFFLGFGGIRRNELRAYDAFTDIPVLRFFRELDRRYPGSRFILTIRDRDSWLDSCRRFPNFGPDHDSPPNLLRLREDIYGTQVFDRARFSEARDRHHEEIRSYFGDRPEDLLEMSIVDGDGWEPLCSFLGCPAPDVPFPHRNAGRGRPT